MNVDRFNFRLILFTKWNVTYLRVIIMHDSNFRLQSSIQNTQKHCIADVMMYKALFYSSSIEKKILQLLPHRFAWNNQNNNTQFLYQSKE